MFFTGISDEAGKGIDAQIKAHKDLGWDHIELRMIDGKQFTDLDDGEFDAVCAKLADAGIKVSCFASAIANWARHISGDFQVDVNDLKRAIPRMQKLGTPFIRVMSWPNAGENPLGAEKWKEEAFRRMRELTKMAEDGGVTLVIENCDGWAAQSGEHMAEFISTIDSKALRLVFDTGNSVPHNLNSLEFYTAVKPYIAYIHIKDNYRDTEDQIHYVWPNVGCGYVRQILTDVFRSGYDGGISIEPHLMHQVHLQNMPESAEKDAELFNMYTEYGRRLMDLVKTIKEKL